MCLERKPGNLGNEQNFKVPEFCLPRALWGEFTFLIGGNTVCA